MRTCIAFLGVVVLVVVTGGMIPQSQLGIAVDDAVAASIRGGCMAYGSDSCVTKGSCSSTSIVYFSGDGDYEQDTTTNCGGTTSCVSYSKTAKKCGG